MRLWSIHPKYLDSKGLVALWRESLLAKKVLENKTKGYKNHPQLERFKQESNPVDSINSFLLEILKESEKRGYCFDSNKMGDSFSKDNIQVTDGQILYELEHLKNKLKSRDKKRYSLIKDIKLPEINPVFKISKGDLENWEKR
jgi:hypothetical protein